MVVSSWTSVVVINFALCMVNSEATFWRQRSDYPRSYDDFEMYVTERALPVTGERAFFNACGAEGRPYKYRGKNHLPALQNVFRQSDVKKVWVGAVDTTTPWVWTNGRYLYQLMGLIPGDQNLESAVRIPGNNVFLCSLHCRQVSFILLQGNMCACSKTKPEMLPVSGELLRCPGTYDDHCGTSSAYTVYKTMLAKTVKWARLVDKARYYGNKAYLYRSPLSDDPQVTLMAEADSLETKGHICNGTVFSVGSKHIKHLWVEHAQTAPLTWRDSLLKCMNKGKQLMMISRDAKDCVPEIERELRKGQSYWVGLSRQNIALWLDGTTVKTSVIDLHQGQAACLTMSLTSRTPTFAFESCTGLRLPVLCERDTKSRQLHSFTHDAEGNHIITRKSSNENDYPDTVAILVAVLVVLSLLSIILLILLYNRDKWMSQKSQSTRQKTSSTRVSKIKINGKQNVAVIGRSDKEHVTLHNIQLIPEELRLHDTLGYAIVGKGKRSQSLLTGSDNSRPTSASVEYTEVGLADECGNSDKCDNIFPKRRVSENPPTELVTEKRRASSMRLLDCQMDSSQSSVTGSDDAYSVLGYRKAIQTAWTGIKRTAYAHVMINRPMKCVDLQSSDESGLYDIARTRPPRVRCIDNDYDHAEPRLTKSRSLSYPHDARFILEMPIRCNESEV